MMLIGIQGDIATIKRTCPFCGCQSEVEVPTEGVKKYQAGAYVQDAFPTCSVETREFIISGMCRDCQNDIFIEDDEEV